MVNGNGMVVGNGGARAWALAALVAPLVAVARPPQVVGTMVKDQSAEHVTFDVKLEADDVTYHVEGTTTLDKGVYLSDTRYDSVRVTKRVAYKDGTTRKLEYKNEGTVHLYPRKRKLEGVTLADVPLSGYFLQGMVDRGLWFDHLTAGSDPCVGVLDYILVNGRYREQRNLSFGGYRIASTLPNSRIVLNRDNIIGQNRTKASMTFGQWQIGGQIQFSDVTRTVGSGDDQSTVLAQRTARFGLTLSKEGGKAIRFAKIDERETDDDVRARYFLAMLELLSYDLVTQ